MTSTKTETVITPTYMPAGRANLTGWSVIDSFSVVTSNSTVLLSIVRRDLLSRFRGSVLGRAWIILLPLIMMAVYSTIFSYALGVRFKGASGLWESALATWFSLVVWQAIAECVTRSASAIHDNAPFVKRMPFPVAILPVSLVLAAFGTAAVSFGFFAIGYVAVHHHVPLTWLYLPLILAPLLVGLTGVVWLISAAGGLLRDIRHIVPVAMTLGMFATPVVWPIDIIPAAARAYLQLNPLCWFFESLRNAIFGISGPDTTTLAMMSGGSLLFWVMGFAVFRSAEREMRDVV
ncbi:ABC transporter permease [Agrobacterium rubi]|nr:ABC transporter permease [Agrobacterium rubi]NTF24670.1 ABC transporter permease [Agrobacterium rubi]